MFSASISLPDLQRNIKRAAAGLLFLAIAIGIGAISIPAHAQASGVEISSGRLFTNSNNGPKWLSVDFDALTTGDHDLTVTWDNVGVDLRISVFDDATGDQIGNRSSTPGQIVWTGALETTGEYRISIWVAKGGVTDYVANLSADGAGSLSIVTQPSDQTVAEGQDVVFSVAATSNSDTISYQWRSSGGGAISGATTDTLRLSEVTVADSGSEYSVVVSDDNGNVVPSATARLEVLPASGAVIGEGIVDSDRDAGPRWTRIDFDPLASATHEITVAWNSGADVRFRIFEVNGPALSPVIRGTNPGVWQGELDGDESYFIGLWSTDGVADFVVTVEASEGPSITTQPRNQTASAGEDVTFNVVASGSGSLDYQWYVDDTEIDDATDSELTIEGVILAESGSVYSVEVGDNGGTTFSEGARLTVLAPPALTITTEPTDQTVDEDSDVVFTVEISGGSGQVNYQWYADGSSISGATTDTLRLFAVTVDDDKTVYSVVVSDANSTVVSDEARLTVVATPSNDEDVLARWDMNESPGASVIRDTSGNGRNGTIGLDVVTGDVDRDATAYRWLFTPPTESHEPERIVNVPHDSDLNPGTGDYSITMRYRTLVSFGNIIQKGQGGAAGGYWKIENPGGNLTCVFRGVANNGGWNRKEVVSSRPLNDGEYHTITCERIDNTLRLIVDGVLDDTANNSTGSIANNQPISIGGKTNCDNVRTSCDYFTGWIDEISIGKPD